MADEFCLKMPDFHVTFRDLLHALNLRHGTKGLLPYRREACWKIRRLRPGLNSRTWVPKASTLPLDHRSRYYYYYYNQREGLAVDEMIVLYKGTVTLWKCVAINIKYLVSKLTNFATLCATHVTWLCLGKQRQHVTSQTTATHGTVLQVIRRDDGLGHNVFMYN